ncbi:MAG: MMPL family transporter [Pseudomonadota bacterium]
MTEPRPFFEQLTEQLIRFRWLSLAMVALISAAAVTQLPKLQIDNSNEAFFMEGDPAQERLDQFRETFGNDDFAFILIDVEDAFAPDTLQRLAELADRLEYEVPHLLDLTWIGNVEWIEGVPGGIVIEELITDLNAPRDVLDAIGTRAAADPLYQDRLVSTNRDTVGLLIEFENYPDEGIDPRKDSPPVIRTIVEEFPDLDSYIVGGPISDYVMDERTAIEAPVWMTLAILGMAFALAITTRSLKGVLVPTATVLISVLWTMGLVALLGYTLNILVILVPTLLLCVGIGDSMHVVAELTQLRREGQPMRRALAKTLDLVTRPIVLTTVTTAAGFLAFTVTDLVPLQELGVQAAAGVVIALLLTYLFAVPVLSFTRKTEATPERTPDFFDRLLTGLAHFVVRHQNQVGIAFLLFTAVMGYGMTRLEIDTNTVNAMDEDHPLRMAFEYVDERMGGSMSIEIVVNTGDADGIKRIELLKKVERLQTFLGAHPLVTQTSSVIDQLKQMHRAVHENDPAAYALPERDTQVAEYLLLYESGGGSQLEQYVSFTYDQLRLQARTRSIDFGAVRELQEAVDGFVTREFDGDVEIYATGTLPMFQRLGDLLAEGQARSFLFAFCAIGLILIGSLRSVRLGLIAMVPNVLPVFVALGAMGWAGAEMNMIMLVLAPMILGVAVDDTVHFFTRYRRYFDSLQSYDAAYLETMRTVGRPLLFTTVVLVIGFSGFLITVFDGPRNFSMASMFAFSVALLAEFLLAPVLLAWFQPLGKSTEPLPTAVAAT